MGDRSFYAATLYIASHLFGLIAGLNMLPGNFIQSNQLLNQKPISGLYLLGMIVVASGTMLLLLHWNRKLLIKLWFNSALVLTVYIFFASFMSPMTALGPAIAVFIVRVMSPGYGIRNLADIFSYAGAGALFGTMLGVVPALIFLVFLGIYDIVSVFLTGHMVDLAVKTVENDSFMGIMLPETEEESERAGSIEETGKSSDRDTVVGMVGGGDVIGPMVLSVSLLKILPLASAVMTSIGSMLGLYFLMERKGNEGFLPAIPFVAAGGILGLAVSLLFV